MQVNILKNNLCEIYTKNGKYLQSYKSIVAFIPQYHFLEQEVRAVVYPDWDYSNTTTRDVAKWLRMTPKEIRDGIKNGIIKYEQEEPEI